MNVDIEMAVNDLDKLEDVLKKIKKMETETADTISVSVVVREDA